MHVDEVAQALAQLDRTMRYARAKLGADITIQRLLILINVYLHEGLSQKELLSRLDATSVTALSRNLADLSAWTTRKQPGPGLIELKADPMNLRRKTVHLTAKGRRLIKQVASAPGIGVEKRVKALDAVGSTANRSAKKKPSNNEVTAK